VRCHAAANDAVGDRGREYAYRAPVVPGMDVTQLAAYRANKDEFLGCSPHSPLSPETRRGFTGLRYFEPNPQLVFDLAVTPGDGTSFRVETSDGASRMYARAGTVSFQVDGSEVELALYDTGHEGWFLPFRDATSGGETYGAGRYLDLQARQDGTITLDFNLAYNPFCAYDDAYSCPLPPAENWLQVPIEAGELDFPA